MKRRSLVTTLVLRLALIGTLLTVANVAVVIGYYASNKEDLRREKFDRQIDDLASAVARSSSGALRFEPRSSLLKLFDAHPDAYAFRITAGHTRILGEANPKLLPDDRWSGKDGPDAWLSTVTIGGMPVVVGSRLVANGGESVRITFAASGDPANLFRFVFYDELFVHVVISLLPFAAVLLMVNSITVRRSLHPLVHAASVARTVGATTIVKPLPTDNLPSEVLALVEATNGALHRLELALEAEKAFTAEAAHALRTPLSVLSARIESLPASEQITSVKADIAALSRLTNQLLSAAQADTLVVDPDRHCDLSIIAATVVAGIAPLAIRDGRSLALEAEEHVIVHGDGDALAHALRNLIENALRFSPRGSEVLVMVSRDGTLSVLDRGPGVSEADKPLLTKRFWRRPATGLGGTGLGLSIVERIADAHHTRLEIHDRPGGGTTFSIPLHPVSTDRAGLAP